MRLSCIIEAFDKNLANKLAAAYDLSLPLVRHYVERIDPKLHSASWVMKVLLVHGFGISDKLAFLLERFYLVKKKYPAYLKSNDINQYSYEELESLVGDIDIGDIRASLPGVERVLEFTATEGFGIRPGKKATIRAYIVTDGYSVAEIGKNAEWCTHDGDLTEDFIAGDGPIVIITRNSEAISQGQLYSDYQENSHCVTEKRPEVLGLFRSIRAEYAERYKKKYPLTPPSEQEPIDR